jgi:hypothetical protein
MVPATEERKMQHSWFPTLFTVQRSRKAGFSCYNVTPLSKNCCSTSLFTTGYKRLPEGGCEVFWMGRFFDGRFFDGDGLIGGLLVRMTLLVGC